MAYLLAEMTGQSSREKWYGQYMMIYFFLSTKSQFPMRQENYFTTLDLLNVFFFFVC